MENTLLSNRTYRLYAGHGNWINLGVKTTNELLDIFSKGLPTRYQLAPGLFIDIIPHDVDCNSKNIDMLGLMRADLVYETSEETTVQQFMSNYIHSILDDQGIIDVFPPVKSGENLPVITSLPSHRHLSLVPSTTSITRRGPKPTHDSDSSSSKTTCIVKKKTGSFSKRSHKRAKTHKAEKMLLPSSSIINSYGDDMDFTQPRHPFWVPPASFLKSEIHYKFDPPSTSIHPSASNVPGFDGPSTFSSVMTLNSHEMAQHKARSLQPYYPCSQHSPSSVATNTFLDHYDQPSSSFGENSNDTAIWDNSIKEDGEQWMSSEYNRKDSDHSIIVHPETALLSSFDLRPRSCVDHGYYFNDSSKSTTGPASPTDLSDMTVLPIKRLF